MVYFLSLQQTTSFWTTEETEVLGSFLGLPRRNDSTVKHFIMLGLNIQEKCYRVTGGKGSWKLEGTSFSGTRTSPESCKNFGCMPPLGEPISICKGKSSVMGESYRATMQVGRAEFQPQMTHKS